MASKIKMELPTWWEDPLVSQTQNILFPFASNILKGELPDYYKPVGDTNSLEFNNMLNQTKAGIQSSTDEALAARNINRGGLGASISGQESAKAETSLRWQDYVRAMQNRLALLGVGTETMSGVRSSAMDMTGARNNFNLNRAQLQLGINTSNANAKSQQNAMWGQILSSAIGAAGTVLAGPVGGIAAGAAANGVSNIAGSSFNSAGLSFSSLFN